MHACLELDPINKANKFAHALRTVMGITYICANASEWETGYCITCNIVFSSLFGCSSM